MDKPKNKSIAFHGGNAEAQAVYQRVLELCHKRKQYAWEVIRDGLAAIEKLDQIKVIHFSPDMELSDFVKNVVQSAVDDIADSNDPETGTK